MVLGLLPDDCASARPDGMMSAWGQTRKLRRAQVPPGSPLTSFTTTGVSVWRSHRTLISDWDFRA